jgi:type I restriction enzyme S subunit
MKLQKQSVYDNKPEDWSITPIKKIGEVVTGTTPRTSVDEYYDGPYLFVSPGDLDDSRVVNNSVKSLTKKGFEETRPVPKNSVLFTSIGSTIGKTSIAGCKLATNQQINAITTNDDFDPDYVYNTLIYYRNYIRRLAGTQAVPIINKSSFESIRLPFPPKEEQVKIIETLNTWDKALSTLEDLIRAKKRYKKGLMQQLLSGQKRFSEFEGEPWVEVEFGNVFQRVTEKNEAEEITNVLTISAQDGLVSQTDYYNKSVASKDLSRYIVIKEGDFAYNKSYSEGYPLGAIKRLEDYESGVLSPLYICFRPDSSKIDSDFMTHFFENGGLDHQIYKIAREGARNHGLLNVSIKDFLKITFKIPSIEEQKRIAAVLNQAKKRSNCLKEN